jgi:hypothetical protein
MKPTPCGFEAAVTAAAGSEALTPALRDHVSGCHYRGVWLRAEYARRQQRRARRELVQAIVPAAATAVFVSGLLIWKRPSLHDLVRGSIDLVASVPSLFTGGVTLAVLLGFVMLTFVLMEDSWSRDR